MRTMVHLIACFVLAAVAAWARVQSVPSPGPTGSAASLTERGQLMYAGRTMSYVIPRLPVSSFPDLPGAVVEMLNQRGCTIPQTYEAHRPENVVHASLERSGSSDWAVLCSTKGTVSLLVFFSELGAANEAGGNSRSTVNPEMKVLASAPETERLEDHDASGVLGFDWGIDPATPEQVHEAQVGVEPRPAKLDHDALAESIVEHKTIYHFYAKAGWMVLKIPD